MSWVSNEDQLEGLPPAPFRLSNHEVLLADERAKSVLVPFAFGWRPQPLFCKPSAMKAHDWKQVAIKGVLKFCLRGMLGSKQRKTLFTLMDALSELFRDKLMSVQLTALSMASTKLLLACSREHIKLYSNICCTSAAGTCKNLCSCTSIQAYGVGVLRVGFLMH